MKRPFMDDLPRLGRARSARARKHQRRAGNDAGCGPSTMTHHEIVTVNVDTYGFSDDDPIVPE